eukprot:364027-Amorphochlora_amoeboformis.AAC.2
MPAQPGPEAKKNDAPPRRPRGRPPSLKREVIPSKPRGKTAVKVLGHRISETGEVEYRVLWDKKLPEDVDIETWELLR